MQMEAHPGFKLCKIRSRPFSHSDKPKRPNTCCFGQHGFAEKSFYNKGATRSRSPCSKTIPYDPEIRIEYGGDYAALVKAIKQFIIIIIMAIILVFAVMASQFESLLDPFIVLFTMPLMIVGIVFVYALTGLTLNVMTAVGVLILVGIIVNNGIVLVDYTNLLRKRGLPLIEACAEAGRSRLRPILMTTLTTILGLVPMAFFPGEGSEMVQPIGQTVLGGLSFGTLMTLFLMPVLYAIFNQMRGEKIETN